MSNLDKIDHQEILEEAISFTGLSDFGPNSHLQGLERLCWSLNYEADLNDIGRSAQISRITGLLVNRLLLEEDFKKNSIDEEEMKPPLVIVGLPRTGSTMIHRLLASDPDHTAMIWWEGRNPSRLKGEKRGEPHERILLGKKEVEIMVRASPDLMKIHPMDAMAADEEILLIEHSFHSTVPESFMNLPSYSEWVESQDHTTSYEYLKRMLQYLQWQNLERKGKSWVLKTPHHMGFVDVILKVFPGAKIIQTHRSPLETIPSYCSMVSTLAEPLSNKSFAKNLGKHWEEKLSRALKHCMHVSDNHPNQFLDLNYKKLISEPIDEMEVIYNFLDKPYSSEAKEKMILWKEENIQNKHGSHEYNVEDYGINDKKILEDFDEYITKYDLT